MVVTHPSVSARVARSALERDIAHVWFHRSFGEGRDSTEASAVCRTHSIEPIVGGCPLMYCPPVDPGHGFFRWWLRLRQHERPVGSRAEDQGTTAVASSSILPGLSSRSDTKIMLIAG